MRTAHFAARSFNTTRPDESGRPPLLAAKPREGALRKETEVRVKLHKKPQQAGLGISAMSDGDIAEVLAWSLESTVGQIVQRHGVRLIVLGQSSGTCYGGGSGALFAGEFDEQCRVRILENGELIEVVRGM